MDGIKHAHNYPFKFNNSWLFNEELCSLVKRNWQRDEIHDGWNAINLLVLKKDITIWIKDQKKKDNEGYCNIDDNIKDILVISEDFILNEEERLYIMDLEFRRSALLRQEEMERWLKIRALWADLGRGQ